MQASMDTVVTRLQEAASGRGVMSWVHTSGDQLQIAKRSISEDEHVIARLQVGMRNSVRNLKVDTCSSVYLRAATRDGGHAAVVQK